MSHRGKALMQLKNEFDKVLQWLKRRFEEEQILRGAHDICQHMTNPPERTQRSRSRNQSK